MTTCGDIQIWREGSNVGVEAVVDGTAVKRYYELFAWEREARRWGDDFWERAQAKFEQDVSGGTP